MAAYMNVAVSITDEEQFGIYRNAVTPLIAHFGGRQSGAGMQNFSRGDRMAGELRYSSSRRWRRSMRAGTPLSRCL
jgi:hypothetical protein